jgi:YegS/Rv2252/BmrU family lipid kinase
MEIVVIVNKHAYGGIAERRWLRLAKELDKQGFQLEEYVTQCAGDGVRLGTEAMRYENRFVAVAGGDGTISEVLNGMAQTAFPIAKPLALLPIGRGNDFSRSFGFTAQPDEITKRLTRRETRTVDIGLVHYHGRKGPQRQYFVNLAAGGQAAELAYLAAGLFKSFSARIAYDLSLALTVFCGHHWKVRIKTCNETITSSLNGFLICNGPFAGGGMRLAPEALVDDGFFELIGIPHLSRGEIMKALPNLYQGTYLSHPKVIHRRIREVEIESDTPLPLQLDGNPVGTAPVTCKVIPEALRILV